jgi:hypothetical protein
MSIIEYLKGEIEAIGVLIEQKTKEIEDLTKRKVNIEKEIKGEPKTESKEEPVEEKAEAKVEEVEAPVEEAPAEEAGYDSWDRDQLKEELASREIEFAKNAKTEKLIELLQESDQ